STDVVSGTFAGLPEGGTVTIAGRTFSLSYAGGTGNDIVLTAHAPTAFAVTNVNDSGAGSLRQAIVDANAHPGADTITSGTGDGVGIVIFGASTSSVCVYGNYLGTDSTGTIASANGQGGIWIGPGTSNVTIGTNADGTDDAAERNVISGNAGTGILVQTSG